MKALAVTSAAFLLLVTAVVSWFAVSGDPLGGEPYALVAIKQSERPMPYQQAVRAADETPAEQAAATQAGAGQAPPQAQSDAKQASSAPGISIAGLQPPAEQAAAPAGAPAQGDQESTLQSPPPLPPGQVKLAPVPVEDLVETSRYGPLPKVAADGRRPSDVYARPAPGSVRPQPGEPARVAILVTGLGLSETATTQAINDLPGPVTLAFGPYGRNLQGWVRKARDAGHEVMLQVPLEPFDYPDNDPGPHTLLTSLPPEENMKRLQWLMSRFSGYTGLTNHMGAKFSAAQESFLPVLEELKSRGLIYVDDGTAARSTAGQIARDLGMRFSVAQIVLDASTIPDDIDKALKKLETMARENGFAVAVASSLPVTVERLAKWAEKLKERGIVLVPVSAAVRAQEHS